MCALSNHRITFETIPEDRTVKWKIVHSVSNWLLLLLLSSKFFSPDFGGSCTTAIEIAPQMIFRICGNSQINGEFRSWAVLQKECSENTRTNRKHTRSSRPTNARTSNRFKWTAIYNNTRTTKPSSQWIARSNGTHRHVVNCFPNQITSIGSTILLELRVPTEKQHADTESI